MPRNLIDSEIRDFSEEQGLPYQGDAMDQEALDAFIAKGREMIVLRENKAVLEQREAALKKDLMAALERYGEPYGPEGQHRAVAFPSPIRSIVRMVRQAKTTTSVDETQAEAIARKRGLYDRLFTMRPVLDQEAVMVAVAEGLITDRELDLIFPKKVIHAFVMEKEKR